MRARLMTDAQALAFAGKALDGSNHRHRKNTQTLFIHMAGEKR